jgi:hypothetical protein
VAMEALARRREGGEARWNACAAAGGGCQ